MSKRSTSSSTESSSQREYSSTLSLKEGREASPQIDEWCTWMRSGRETLTDCVSNADPITARVGKNFLTPHAKWDYVVGNEDFTACEVVKPIRNLTQRNLLKRGSENAQNGPDPLFDFGKIHFKKNFLHFMDFFILEMDVGQIRRRFFRNRHEF